MVEKRTQQPRGFALPTVLIASVVMLTVMAVSVASVSAISTALRTQYYEQLAKIAGESGVAYAKACLAKNGNVPQWSDAKPLTPATDCAGNPQLNADVQALIVAGGGGGGNTGSGGGAGGVLQIDSIYTADGNYPIVVGNGGAGGTGTGNAGGKGGNSSFAGYIAEGGGAGISHNNSAGGNGGSGGGGPIRTTAPTATGGTASQGFQGGAGFVQASYVGGNGGGGGAGGAGQAGGNALGNGDGGIGISSTITGATVFYAGGGGGGEVSGGADSPGRGAGGDTRYGAGSGALNAAGSAAVANTGSGGGGGSFEPGSPNVYYAGGAGGSGVVVIRYPIAGGITATGGTITDAGAYRVHRFTSNGTFTVTSITGAGCPTDPRCSVTVNGNARSSFSVGMPTVDSAGKAIAIPNTGYVELTRESNGAVWRTIRQPAVQAVTAPNLCSTGATSGAGWSNAQRATAQSALPDAPSAETISFSSGTVNGGAMYFRKEFSVTEERQYKVSIQSTRVTGGAQDVAELFVDGVATLTSQGAYASGTVLLTPGCHVVAVKLTNNTLHPSSSSFTAAIQANNGTPIVTSDTSWRVSVGSSAHFSEQAYYVGTNRWQTMGSSAASSALASATSANWTTNGGNSATNYYLLKDGALCGGTSCPTGYIYLRAETAVVLGATTTIRITSLCRYNCVVYANGSVVQTNAASFSSSATVTLSLPAGTHRFGVRLNNTADNPGIGMSVIRTSDSAVLTRIDDNWLLAKEFGSSTVDPVSYATTFTPTPF